MRIELEETALVRPSNAASVRRSGSGGSTTITDSPLLSSAEASARPTNPPPKMIASARSIRAPYRPDAGTPRSSLDPRLRVRDSSERYFRVEDMATVVARASKRELAPDWRDALRASLKRFAVRTWGALL